MMVDLFYPYNTPRFVLTHFTLLTSLLDTSQFMPLLLTSFLAHFRAAQRTAGHQARRVVKRSAVACMPLLCSRTSNLLAMLAP